MSQSESEFQYPVPNIPGPPLRKLLRSKTTKAFLTYNGTWTKDIATAAVFNDFSAAIAAKNTFDLDGEVELYFIPLITPRNHSGTLP